jgi:hypothetical protein
MAYLEVRIPKGSATQARKISIARDRERRELTKIHSFSTRAFHGACTWMNALELTGDRSTFEPSLGNADEGQPREGR